MPWLRRVELIVTRRDDPENKVIFKKHRIDVEVRSTIGWPADTASVAIFNLSLAEVKFLQTKEFGALGIEIRAGYEQEDRAHAGAGGVTTYGSNNSTIEITPLPTLFSGTITNAVGFRRPPEHVTQLFCISKAYGNSTEFRQMSNLAANQTLKQAIQQMCNDYGFSTISMFGVTEELLNTKLKRPRVFHDVFLNEFKTFLGEYNLLFTMTTNEIQIFPDTYGNLDAVDRMAKDRPPIALDVNSVIGNPVAGICTLQLDTFINPSIQPGMILDITPLVGSEILANGVVSVQGDGIALNTDQSIFRWAMTDKYVITEVVHRVSTHVKDLCQTSLISVIGGSTEMGGSEAAWQSAYMNSGMAMELE